MRGGVFSVIRAEMYKRGKLGAVVSPSMKRRVKGWCEMANQPGSSELLVEYSPAGKDLSRGYC